ncbi:MAG: RluA family pseudouridine synthase, partial [Alphaproteobacteria bacterium]|nr:RluA family pseudouridine synthase [Alphaproteobacteria bacterium]
MATFQQTEICTSSDVRVDRYLKRLYPALNQAYIEKLLRSKKITVNGQKVKSNHRLNAEDAITILTDLSAFKESPKEQTHDAPLSKADRTLIEDCIIYEDEVFCIFNKPHGLAVQGGSGIQRHVDGLFKKYKKDVDYKLVHRLDRDTSGLLILAKSIEAAQYFTQLFKQHTIQKTYLALVHGRIKNQQGIISAPLLKDYQNDVEKMMVSDKGKEAITHYMVLGYHDQYTLVELSPKTGRTHQLRVH